MSRKRHIIVLKLWLGYKKRGGDGCAIPPNRATKEGVSVIQGRSFHVNLGTSDALTAPIESTFARAGNIDQMWRIAPRVSAEIQNLRIAFEVKATSVSYGSSFDSHYAPVFGANDKAITNLLTLIAAYYSF
ncbi:MAG: hypothetical protein HN774_05660 [Bacteroidetes Order II. Incertae sedis bacterium]|nr:hypothetical protein [Bacteroidetes Order II. bacterium]MBT7400631.1 hypothetical protein [Bacteroidetes Order II. bacterium]